MVALSPSISPNSRTGTKPTYENGNAAGGADGGDNVAEALKAQKIGSKLGKKGILEKIDGKKFAAYELTKAPEYYVVYFSASW
jgi:hypothetical protein